MNDRVFLDTNVLIYFYSDDDEIKRNIAYHTLNNHDCVTNIQALSESCNVWLKKYSWNTEKIKAHLDNIELVCNEILSIHRSTITKALALKGRYGYSYYDCLMLASALDGDCRIIFTEDMSDGQIINDTLKIVNPFGKTQFY
ncbi:MAG: PIN domain-containing protein [Synergistaceae bacterium]|nr:PIN domain-containing protein [Synergistaceae bacterium]